MGYVFTQDAKENLLEIMAYIALDNPAAAERVQLAILDTCDSLATMPGIGHNPKFINDPDISAFNVTSYSDYHIFYKKRDDHILILAVLHGARDLQGLFSQ